MLTAAGAWAVQGVAAASQVAPRDTLPLSTLSVWAEDVWLDLLDREGTIRGPLAVEGILQRFHPRMDPEYALDARTGLFTAVGDAAWAWSGGGIRAAGSSISHPHILNRVDWRQSFPVAGPVELTADYTRDHSLTDRRDYPRLGVRWRGIGGSGWTAWSRIGVHFLKPAADVEVGAARSWPAGEGGSWRLELRMAALDVFSDAIFVGLGVDPRDVEAHVDHAAPPFAARVFVERRGRLWRFEAHGGATPRARSRVTFPGGGAPPFDLTERVAFAGALAEVAPAPGLSAAGYARVARAETRRAYAPETTRSLSVTEQTEALGGYLRQRLAGDLTAEAELHAVWRPETRTEDGGDVDHEDREIYGAVALVRRTASGWTARLGYAGLDRDSGALLPSGAGRNHRLVMEGGYHTAAGFEVSAGVRWDLDEIGTRAFDGAHLRLSAVPFGARSP